MKDRYKLMIVDDEALVRERFRYAFKLEEHGYEVAGEAEDGEEALQLLKQTEVDIVITDIVMPRMDGLELTRRLKQFFPHIPVIILSNYQEFHFAQKAVALGAVDYLLKVTTDANELLSLLGRVRNEIALQRERTVKELNEKDHFLRSMSAIRQQFLQDLLNGMFTSEHRLNSYCNYLRLFPFSETRAITAAFVQITRYCEMEENYHIRDIRLFKVALMQIAEETAQQRCRSNIIPWADNRMILLIHWDDKEIPYIRHTLEFLYPDLIANTGRFLPFSIVIGSSGVIPVLSGENRTEAIRSALSKAIHEARLSLYESFYKEEQQIFHYDEKNQNFQVIDEPSKEYLRNIFHSLNPNKERSVLVEEIRSRMIPFLKKRFFRPDDVLDWLKQITYEMCKLNSEEKERYTKQLACLDNIGDVCIYLARLLEGLRKPYYGLLRGVTSCREDILQVLQYIDNNYETPLTVEQVSQRINMSPNYFSYLFKKEVGMNFLDYVTRYRIEQAKRLLSETTMQIQEIGIHVGIQDYKYFAKLFRKLTGKTPTDFRKEKIK